ncbi:hypothetical protein GYB22_01320 [bacterium]|nr:hypothetical protein [bacterium]
MGRPTVIQMLLPFRNEEYQYTSVMEPEEIKTLLQSKTKINRSFYFSFTDKKYIGHVETNYFKISSSTFRPYGIFCVAQGTFLDENRLDLKFKINDAFEYLYLIWFIVILILTIVGSIMLKNWVFVIAFPLMASIFRLYFIGMHYYVKRKLKKMLEAELDLSPLH